MRLVRTIYELARDTVAEYLKDRCPRLGAALAFYTLLSLAPLLLVVIGLVGPVVGADAARGQVVSQFRDLAGEQGAEAVDTMLDSTKSPSGGLIATLLGLGLLVFGATSLFAQLQDALNAVWNVPEPEGKGLGLWRTLRDQLLSFASVCGLGFLLLVSLVAGAVLTGVSGWAERQFGLQTGWLEAANVVLSMGLAVVLFAFVFKVLPAAKVGWGTAWVGGAVTAALFTLGKYLIGVYLGRAAVGSSYGAAGSLAVLLIWVYYSSQLVLLGAEFTQVYARRFAPAADRPEPAPVPAPPNAPSSPAMGTGR